MTDAGASHLQRLLADEFGRCGWEYDLSAGSTIVDEIRRRGVIDPAKLARVVPAAFLKRNGASREDVSGAIERAIGGRTVAASLNQMPSVDGGITVLFVAAGPGDEPRLRLNAELRDITARIRAATASDRVQVEAALATRTSDLIDAINRARPAILHIAAHGGPRGLAFEDADGNTSIVTTDQLTRLIRVADPTLRLVVLNSCESTHQAQPMVADVDAAIGMAAAIGDEAARVFAAQLYASLAEGVPLSRAFEQAKLQVNLAGIPEDHIPQLFTRDGVDPVRLVFTS